MRVGVHNIWIEQSGNSDTIEGEYLGLPLRPQAVNGTPFARWPQVQNRVRALRKERGLRQEELAGRLNVSQQTISRIENGGNSLAPEILASLSRFFNVSVDYILCLSDYRGTYELAVSVNGMMEENYKLCEMYDRLDKVKRKLIMELMEEFTKDLV